ncbi:MULTISPECIES: fused MFS/spermidine synthase [Arthrobacter]|uniref:Fused MFS/spermidine synthase n=2 Tax=Arthrobacter TaxID=1663 RepID=A0ABU9KFI1_9MICC|nr:fused MFS/spermidine synthase [Arthrobacter sp. YJM1]MDP5225552.1 fused MFS/spermidine synthase [Arthrobacter sp. YJM1]
MSSRYLRASGVHATIEPDTLVPGSAILALGGAEQSHVNLADPSQIFYEYLARMAHVTDLVAPAGEPVTAAHLGAGALTLPRYLQHVRPGSRQWAVELERELPDFVLAELPLPAGARLEMALGDARAEFAALEPESDGEPRRFDVVVLDVFSGPEAPAHLASADFYREVAERLEPGGVFLVNVGDDPPLTLIRSQGKALLEVFDGVAALCESGMLSGRYPGNIVFAARAEGWPAGWTDALLAAGPHPASVLSGMELEDWLG